MGTSPYEKVNVKQAKRLLRAITDLARESSLTGSLEKGARAGVRQYNGLLDHFEDGGVVPKNLFSRLQEDEDSFDELGVACALLGAYIEEDDVLPPMPPAAPAPPSMILHADVRHSDSQELRELRELRELLRERLPDV